MSTRDMQGLSLDQAPPLATIAPFFLAAPLFVVLAGGALAFFGAAAVQSPWDPVALGLMHLGTLGFLAMVMIGAVYQMIPVVVGGRVPAMRLAHAVFAGMVIGVVALVIGLGLQKELGVLLAIWTIGPALLLFLFPTAWALHRSASKSETARGMRFALLSLFGAAFLGVWMAHGHAGMGFPGDRMLFVRAHLTVGLLGWVGSLIAAVSWQAVPMFYLAEPVPRWLRRTVLYSVMAGTVASALSLVFPADFAEPLRDYGAALAVVALFLIHPLITLRSLFRRRRKRADTSLLFWRIAMAMALAVALTVVAAVFSDAAWLGILAAFLAVWGWAGMVIHGMLTRIVPFLVWFHRFSPLAGITPIPSMKDLLPDSQSRIGLALHGGSLFVGAAGIAMGSDVLLRVDGGLWALTGVFLFQQLIRVLMKRPPSLEPKSA